MRVLALLFRHHCKEASILLWRRSKLRARAVEDARKCELCHSARMLPERALEDARKYELRHCARAHAHTLRDGETREESAGDFALAFDYCSQPFPFFLWFYECIEANTRLVLRLWL